MYVDYGHVGQNMVRAADIGVGVSLRKDSHAIDSRYMFLVYEIFRFGSGMYPQF